MKKNILIITFVFFAMCSLFGAEISVAINPGVQWEKRSPQVAVWLEDENENYIATVFVTKGASKKAWKFSPKTGRPDSLPAWYDSSKVNPSKSSDSSFDAVTSATPEKGIVATANVSLQTSKTYIVKAEINQSFDYNETYTKKNSGVDGQPSVIYKGSFVFSDNTPELELVLTETSKGKDELQTISTAKNIVATIYVVIE